jgi:hypothetical protein
VEHEDTSPPQVSVLQVLLTRLVRAFYSYHVNAVDRRRHSHLEQTQPYRRAPAPNANHLVAEPRTRESVFESMKVITLRADLEKKSRTSFVGMPLLETKHCGYPGRSTFASRGAFLLSQGGQSYPPRSTTVSLLNDAHPGCLGSATPLFISPQATQTGTLRKPLNPSGFLYSPLEPSTSA